MSSYCVGGEEGGVQVGVQWGVMDRPKGDSPHTGSSTFILGGVKVVGVVGNTGRVLVVHSSVLEEVVQFSEGMWGGVVKLRTLSNSEEYLRSRYLVLSVRSQPDVDDG